MRGPIFKNEYRPQFSGHETFPIRYGWLKKSYDALQHNMNQEDNKSVFLGEDAIATFGVGKNMVSSIRHWSASIGIIKDIPNSKSIGITEVGHKIFNDNGLDPFLEHPSTIWLLHWQLSGRPSKTTWFWVFNHFASTTFEREKLLNELEELSIDRNWSRVKRPTIKRDVDCFIRTYVPRVTSGRIIIEDSLESPLTELGLIRSIGKRDGFRLIRGPKTSLGKGIFAYALIDFWKRYSKSSAISFEAISHEPGSPGRVFLLDENSLADYLFQIDEVTNGLIKWSETAGLKQVIRNVELSELHHLDLIDQDYK